MHSLLRKIILTLIGVGLLWSFQLSVASDFYNEKSVIVDAVQDEESSEKGNCELEDEKFFNHETVSLKLSRLSLQIETKEDSFTLAYSPSVPTSPPNA
jgi:hypothetical protein